MRRFVCDDGASQRHGAGDTNRFNPSLKISEMFMAPFVGLNPIATH